MRTKIQNREYMNRYRFVQRVEKMKRTRTLCQVCLEKFAITLHHRNEDHNDNRNSNLQPVCRACHLSVKHQEEVKYPQKPLLKPVQPPMQVLQTPKQGKIRPLFDKAVTLLYNSKYNIKIRAEVSLKTIRFLEGLGYDRID